MDLIAIQIDVALRYRAGWAKHNPALHTALLAVQSGECGVCDTLIPEDQKPLVDHNHDSGRIRGLLCHRCNIALGFLEKGTRGVDPEWDRRARGYLDDPPIHRVTLSCILDASWVPSGLEAA